MKKVAVILLLLIVAIHVLILSGCYTKQQALKKFCVPLIKDTTITIHDTIQLHQSQVDSIFLQQHTDTVIVENAEVRVEYIRYRDTVYLRGIAKARTLYINKKYPIKIKLPCPPPKEPPWWHEPIKYVSYFFAFWFIASIILLIVFRK